VVGFTHGIKAFTTSPDAAGSNRLVFLIYLGAAVLALSVVGLGIGLLRAGGAS
jgi:hypothetical protein